MGIVENGKTGKKKYPYGVFFLWACAFCLEGFLGYIGSTYLPREGFVFWESLIGFSCAHQKKEIYIFGMGFV